MGKVVINAEYCKGCALCTTVCPKKLLGIGQEFNGSGFYSARFCGKDDECTGCALCAVMCPDAAIEVWR